MIGLYIKLMFDFLIPYRKGKMMADILFPKWTLYAVVPSNPKFHNGNNLRRNMKCYPIWSESNLAFLSLAIISSVANDGKFLSQVILRKSAKFDKVPEMLENDRAWNLTGSDKSAFIPIESNSFGKWIAEHQKHYFNQELNIRCGIFFYSQACC